MALPILIFGNSGNGKTTSLYKLPPEESFIVDSDKKGLSWKGWKKQYNTENMNYVKTSNQNHIMKYLERINTSPEFAHIKYVVIDTLNGIMIDEEMARMREKNYDRWIDIASSVYGLISYTLTMREDLTVIFTAHAQTERDELGNEWSHIKTSGKKLDKIVLESKFPVVLFAKRTDGEYVFEVHANNSTAKTPMGLYSEMTVPNDIMKVIDDLREYYE